MVAQQEKLTAQLRIDVQREQEIVSGESARACSYSSCNKYNSFNSLVEPILAVPVLAVIVDRMVFWF